jgi:hypothetical protein
MYLVNHTRRTSFRTTKERAIEDYNFLHNQYGIDDNLMWIGYIKDRVFGETIELVDKNTLNVIKKLWKTKDTKNLVKRYKKIWPKNSYDRLCCEDHYHKVRLEEMIDTIYYFHESKFKDTNKSFEEYGKFWLPLKKFMKTHKINCVDILEPVIEEQMCLVQR